MVQGQGRSLRASLLVQHVAVAEMAKAFLARHGDRAPITRRHERYVLGRFQRVFDELPWDNLQIVQFLLELPQIRNPGWGLAIMSMRSHHKVLRTFYAWARAERDPRLPHLPYESFGRRPRRG